MKVQKSGGIITESNFYQQVLRQALYSKDGTSRTLENLLHQHFFIQYTHKEALLKDIIKDDKDRENKPDDSKLSAVSYKELIDVM